MHCLNELVLSSYQMLFICIHIEFTQAVLFWAKPFFGAAEFYSINVAVSIYFYISRLYLEKN